jgi:hypothetical protein
MHVMQVCSQLPDMVNPLMFAHVEKFHLAILGEKTLIAVKMGSAL